MHHSIALILDLASGETVFERVEFPAVIGPVDYAVRACAERDGLVIGKGLFAGSILPGSNRLIFAGRSPSWGGFYLSTMGGAALVFDRVGLEFLHLVGRAAEPSVLILKRRAGEITARLAPIDVESIWRGRGEEIGFYALQQEIFEAYRDEFGECRVLATGPAALHTSIGAIGSAPIRRGEITAADTWAGRGGLGSKLVREHNLVGAIYGGDYDEPDNWRERPEIDEQFRRRFDETLIERDREATTKYRFDPVVGTGGTFGVNYSKLKTWMFSFNYRSVLSSDEERQALWERLIRDHYLEQFNQETIAAKAFQHCGEPCPAVCKKMRDRYKKDYEPYQALGPGAGVFDQRAAELLVGHADALGFDAIQAGGIVSWLMEVLDLGLVEPAALGLSSRPRFEAGPDFDPVADSMHNALLGREILDFLLCERAGALREGLRQGAREIDRHFGVAASELAVYTAFGDDGGMVPNQYWAPGLFAPMPIMGKYFEYYASDFLPPFELGQRCAERMVKELYSDNGGFCRFHRAWVEKILPELVARHFGERIDFEAHHLELARRIQSGNRPAPWEGKRTIDLVQRYLAKVESDDPELAAWRERFAADRDAAAREYWDQIRLGVESLLGPPSSTPDRVSPE